MLSGGSEAAARPYHLQSAPGFGDAPICWKCRGSGKRPGGGKGGKSKRKRKRKRAQESSSSPNLACPVCGGSGRLRTRGKEAKGAQTPGKISPGRPRPPGWVEIGPAPRGSLDELAKSEWQRES